MDSLHVLNVADADTCLILCYAFLALYLCVSMIVVCCHQKPVVPLVVYMFFTCRSLTENTVTMKFSSK